MRILSSAVFVADNRMLMRFVIKSVIAASTRWAYGATLPYCCSKTKAIIPKALTIQVSVLFCNWPF